MADNAEMGKANMAEAGSRGWNPSRGFWIGMIGVAVFASVLAAVGALAAADDSAPEFQPPVGPFPTVIVSYAPRMTTPPDDFTLNGASDPSVALAPAGSAGAATDSSDANPAEAGEPGTVDAFTSSSVLSPTPVASSWTQSPVIVPPAPAAPLSPTAEALVAYANATFGIEIVTDGQDWGDDDAEQEQNIGVVVSAWQRLPLQVTSSVVEHPHGKLQVLSNKQGRTAGGWQPYGDVPTSFYTNSDQGATAYHASNQIVLATGSAEDTVLHELLHAYALRNVGADEYVSAFLDEEMQSFMAASGWQMLVSDDELMVNANVPWDVVNGFFAYTGSGPGGGNPLEGFASAGAEFYGADPIGDLPEFDWFAANLG